MQYFSGLVARAQCMVKKSLCNKLQFDNKKKVGGDDEQLPKQSTDLFFFIDDELISKWSA